MLFFSGLGILLVPVVVIALILPLALEVWVKKQFDLTLPNWLVMTVFTLLPCVGIMGLDRLLNKYGPVRKATDRKTGQEVEVAERHTFMFVPLNWWAYIWLGLMICFVIVGKFG